MSNFEEPAAFCIPVPSTRALTLMPPLAILIYLSSHRSAAMPSSQVLSRVSGLLLDIRNWEQWASRLTSCHVAKTLCVKGRRTMTIEDRRINIAMVVLRRAV